jgi:hypothetical protein
LNHWKESAYLAVSKPDLLVLDVLRAIFAGDINKTEQVKPFLDYLDTLCEKFKTALILVHYATKHGDTASAAGSSYFDGWPELLIHVRNKRKLATCTMAELEFRGRSTDLDPISVVYHETASPIFAAVDGQTGANEFSIAKRFLGSGWAIKDLGEVLGCSYYSARRLIETWLEAEKIQVKQRSGRGGKKRFEFVLSDEPDEVCREDWLPHNQHVELPVRISHNQLLGCGGPRRHVGHVGESSNTSRGALPHRTRLRISIVVPPALQTSLFRITSNDERNGQPDAEHVYQQTCDRNGGRSLCIRNTGPGNCVRGIVPPAG